MADKEMLHTLKGQLRGSRRKIHDNVYKAGKAILETIAGPGIVYRQIKNRLFRFLETSTERQLRVANEWTNLENEA